MNSDSPNFEKLVMRSNQGWFCVECESSNAGCRHLTDIDNLNSDNKSDDLWLIVPEIEKSYPTQLKVGKKRSVYQMRFYDKSTVDRHNRECWRNIS